MSTHHNRRSSPRRSRIAAGVDPSPARPPTALHPRRRLPSQRPPLLPARPEGLLAIALTPRETRARSRRSRGTRGDCFRFPFPMRSAHPGSAMHQHHRGARGVRLAGRVGHQHRDRHPVARRKAVGVRVPISCVRSTAGNRRSRSAPWCRGCRRNMAEAFDRTTAVTNTVGTLMQRSHSMRFTVRGAWR